MDIKFNAGDLLLYEGFSIMLIEATVCVSSDGSRIWRVLYSDAGILEDERESYLRWSLKHKGAVFIPGPRG